MNPLQGPTHTLTPSSIHTQNRPKNNGWIYHLLSSVAGYSPKLTAALKNRGLATLGFQKKFHAHQLKLTQAKDTLQKVNLPPAKLGMLFHVHLSVTEFWPHIYSLSPALSSYQTSQIRPNTKMGGACNAERSTWNSNYESLLSYCHVPTLTNRRKVLKLCLLFNIMTGRVVYPNKPFERPIAHYPNRHANATQLSVPFARTNSFKNSYFPSTTALWNSLNFDTSCIMISSLTSFKHALFKELELPDS